MASIMPASVRVLYIRLAMVGLVAGAVTAVHLPWLVPATVLILATPLMLLLRGRTASVAIGVILALGLVSHQGRQVLQNRLDDDCTGKHFDIRGRVVSLPRVLVLDDGRRRQRFEFEVERISPAHCAGPRRVLLSWYGVRDILPGQRWSFSGRLRRPWGLANEGSFNIQGWYALTGIDAVGSAREQGAVLLEGADGQRINRWRYTVSRAISAADLGARASAVIRAVTVADKSGIDHGLWSLFQQLGINHLLVISGLHVAMVAGLGMLLGRTLAWCLRAAGVRSAVPPGLVAVALALVYTGLAGFSVATQRALFMLLCFIAASALNRGASSVDKLLLSAAMVVLLNPLAPLGSGFWLSFSAVGALLWLAHWQRTHSKSHSVLAAHLYMGLLMLPLGGFWFGGGSWLAAPANLLMVPLVGLYVVPLSLCGVLLLWLGLPGSETLWTLAAAPLELVLQYGADATGGAGLLHLQAGLAGSLLAGLALGLLLVPGCRLRKAALAVLWLPLILPRANLPAGPVLTVLDVGQGTAVVLRVGRRVLLYDTGGGNLAGANLAQTVVIPYLRSQGLQRVDTLVVSHDDLDHSAGLEAIRAALPVDTLWVGGGHRSSPGARRCRAGIAWRWGEHARFQFLSPASEDSLSDNNASCVLAIEIGTRRLLLAGDIEAAQERELVRYWQGDLASRLLLVAHHGSKTSTSQSWLNRVNPQVVVINNAYGNRFGHPARDVIRRLDDQGVRLWHTARTGAVSVAFDERSQWRITGQRQGVQAWWM